MPLDGAIFYTVYACMTVFAELFHACYLKRSTVPDEEVKHACYGSTQRYPIESAVQELAGAVIVSLYSHQDRSEWCQSRAAIEEGPGDGSSSCRSDIVPNVNCRSFNRIAAHYADLAKC